MGSIVRTHVCFALCTFLCFAVTQCYKPVILVHGMLNKPGELNSLVSFINRVHPGTNTTIVTGYDGVFSLLPLWRQVDQVRSTVQKVMDQHPEGVHLLCYSQGGVTCRGVIETLPKHNIHNFVSLSSPQGGQFGDTSYLKYLFPHMMKENIYKLFYTAYGQSISVANYWNDPHHRDLYLNTSVYLPILNNEVITNGSKEFKAAFTRLRNVVLIGGPADEIITPWQSSQFAAYNESEDIVVMRQQEWYTKDLFGLKTLDKRKAITMHTVAGITHHQWHENFTVFQQCIEPWLT